MFANQTKAKVTRRVDGVPAQQLSGRCLFQPVLILCWAGLSLFLQNNCKLNENKVPSFCLGTQYSAWLFIGEK